MELGFLKPLFDRPGPWASVYIVTTRATEDAVKQQPLRRRAVASQLIDAGADARTLRAVMDRLSQEPVSGAPPGRALFAADGEVVLDIPLAETPPAIEATWSTLPHVAPLTGLLGDEPPCLVAYIDRTGADLELRDSHRCETLGTTGGKEWRGRGHRSIPADRYEWHYRNKVENSWNETAEIIAAELARQWPESGAQLLVLTGDSRERRAVHNRLPDHIRAVTVEAENGSRSAGAKKNVLDQQIAQARQDFRRKRLQSALDRFLAGLGRPGDYGPGGGIPGPGDAAEGASAVVDAARNHQVETVLLAPSGPEAGRDVWIGPGVDDVALRPEEARAMGIAEPERARADDAVLRSAAASDAEVLLVPEDMQGPESGLGAVLRWSY
jgi:hypothetical protein